jgi:tetratricopeptide (TPR) repeat protein
MKTKFYLFLLLLLTSSPFCLLHADNVLWALTNLPQGYVYHDFHDGIAVCHDPIKNKYGAIDSNGKISIPVEYDFLSDFNGECAIVRTQDGEGIINTNNEYVLTPQQNRSISILIDNKENAKSLKNGFLIIDTQKQTQAIFFKNSYITEFEPIHSVDIDIHYPLLQLSADSILNTATGEIVTVFYDMGCYYLTVNERNGEIGAVTKDTGEDVTLYTLGDEAARYDALRMTGLQAGNVDVTAMVNNSMDEAIQKYYCLIVHEDGAWQLKKRNGEVKLSLNDEDGWQCKLPFYQMSLVWFERTIPNTSNSQIKIVSIGGEEVFDKTTEGSFKIKLYPKLWHMLGVTMTSYSGPNIAVTEVSPEGIDKLTTFFSIVKANNKYIFSGDECGDIFSYDNYIIHKNENELVIHGLENGKNFTAQEIISCSDHVIFAKDSKGQYFTIQTLKGAKSAIKFENINAFAEGVAVAENKGVKVIVDATGKVRMQDNNQMKIQSAYSSEDVFLVLNENTLQYSYVYNPLTEDTLEYNTESKINQLYDKGKEYYDKKRYSKARKCLGCIIKNDRTNSRALMLYADCYHAQKCYSAAIHYYQRALDIDPSNTQAAEKIRIAQEDKERDEALRATIYSAASSIYSTLENMQQSLSSSQSNTATSKSYSSDNTSSSPSSGGRNDSMYRNTDSKTYSDYESQLIKMNTYWESQYSDNDRKYIQSKMKEIRTKWERRGYKMFHSPWEDWDGRKK